MDSICETSIRVPEGPQLILNRLFDRYLSHTVCFKSFPHARAACMKTPQTPPCIRSCPTPFRHHHQHQQQRPRRRICGPDGSALSEVRRPNSSPSSAPAAAATASEGLNRQSRGAAAILLAGLRRLPAAIVTTTPPVLGAVAHAARTLRRGVLLTVPPVKGGAALLLGMVRSVASAPSRHRTVVGRASMALVKV